MPATNQELGICPCRCHCGHPCDEAICPCADCREARGGREQKHGVRTRKNQSGSRAGGSHSAGLSRLLQDDYREVYYDMSKDKGWVKAGSLGKITFEESGSDDAIIVRIPEIRFKGTAAQAKRIIERLALVLREET
jgi:hypothetical protein